MQIGSTSQRQRCKRMSGGFAEREPLPHRLYLSRRPAPLDINAIRLAIRNTVSDMGSMLRSSPGDARRALGALFGQNRLAGATRSRARLRRARRDPAVLRWYREPGMYPTQHRGGAASSRVTPCGYSSTPARAPAAPSPPAPRAPQHPSRCRGRGFRGRDVRSPLRRQGGGQGERIAPRVRARRRTGIVRPSRVHPRLDSQHPLGQLLEQVELFLAEL